MGLTQACPNEAKACRAEASWNNNLVYIFPDSENAEHNLDSFLDCVEQTHNWGEPE